MAQLTPGIEPFPHDRFSDLTLYHLGHKNALSGEAEESVPGMHYRFYYVLSGKGKLFSTNTTGVTHEYDVSPGRGFMLWPEQKNRLKADAADPWQYIWVEFNGFLARELVMLSGLDFNNPLYEPQDPYYHQQTTDSLLYLKEHIYQPPLNRIGHLYMCLGGIVESSARRINQDAENTRDFYVRRAIHYIDQHFNQDNCVYSVYPIDPFTVTDADGTYPSGDALIVYPGPEGKPLSSLRLMVAQEAMNDFRALKMLEALSGREAVLAIIDEGLDAPLTFSRFPQSNDYLLGLRARINKEINITMALP